MKKILFTILWYGVLILELTGCGISQKENVTASLEDLENINLKIQEYFIAETNDHSNLSYNYVDNEKRVVVVGLIDNTKSKQEELLKAIFTLKEIESIKNQSLIEFRKSEENTTSNVPTSTIEEKIDYIVENGPQESSNPFNYINANKDVYNELLASPKETFEYAINDLIKTNASDGLKSYIEALLCSEINQNFQYDFESGIDYLEHYKSFLTKCDCLYNDYDDYTQLLLKQ